MTTLFSIDPSMQAWQQDSQRPPGKDFAHELARRDEHASSDPAGNADARAPADAQSRAAAASSGVPAMPEPAGATAQSDASIALAKAQQLAQVEVTPTGVTEALLGARVFGWHALAQSYLSELSAADSAADKSAPAAAVTGMAAQETAAAEPGPLAVAGDAAIVTGAAAANPQAAEIAPLPARVAAGDTASASTAGIATADAAAPDYWPERSLRYTRQRDGSGVAWLRDFRLGETEAAHIIQLVLNDAKAKGVSLSRIILNGREAWASPGAQ